jgi:hypothetical protein
VITPDRYCVEPNGCWTWLGADDGHGYGAVRIAGATQKAHRVVYQEQVGPIPDGLDLDHICRNRKCVNPAHCEPVTRAVNLRRGDGTKLTAERVRAIREAVAAGQSRRELAEVYGVTRHTITDVVLRRSWKDVA